MRGTLRFCAVKTVTGGLIPTYAGNTELFFYSAEGVGAHPHVCGEHFTSGKGGMSRAGSSPRMRGTQTEAPLTFLRVGLIPTYAGNTVVVSHVRGGGGAHPHVCGEHPAGNPSGGWEWGSSPRMRGTLLRHGVAGAGRGLIPTYAGNT